MKLYRTAGVSDKDVENLKGSRIFQDWCISLSNNFDVKEVFLTAINYNWGIVVKSPEAVKFARISVYLKNDPNKDWIVELRGDAVVVFMVFRYWFWKYALLVEQPRISTGEPNLLETPAGMIEDGSFLRSAQREVQEETGLSISFNELKEISYDGVFLSPGILDEEVRFYLFERRLTVSEFRRISGRVAGLEKEGERTVLKFVPLEKIPETVRDAKTLAAYALYQEYKRKKLPLQFLRDFWSDTGLLAMEFLR